MGLNFLQDFLGRFDSLRDSIQLFNQHILTAVLQVA
jgi:hypothetical protein